MMAQSFCSYLFLLHERYGSDKKRNKLLSFLFQMKICAGVHTHQLYCTRTATILLEIMYLSDLFAPLFIMILNSFITSVYRTQEIFSRANLANHELFAKNFLTNIHIYTKNVLTYALTVAYSLKFPSPIQFLPVQYTKIFPRQTFPVYSSLFNYNLASHVQTVQ